LLEGWILNVNGASNSKVAGVRIVLTTLKGSNIEQSFTLGFLATNNEAEYEIVMAGLRIATTLGVTSSRFAATRHWWFPKSMAKDERMAAYL